MGDNSTTYVNSLCNKGCLNECGIHYTGTNDIEVSCGVHGNVWPRAVCPSYWVAKTRMVRQLELR
jgi:hypothetical protein